jgi:hypothetical protein
MDKQLLTMAGEYELRTNPGVDPGSGAMGGGGSTPV